MKGDYGIFVAYAAAIFATLCVITSAAPLMDQQQQQQPQHSNSQISNEFNPEAFADYNRYFMKAKKWSGVAPVAAAGSPMNAFADDSESKWAHTRNFFPDKRMDDQFSNDYPSLNPGRLEWNFNRL